MNALPLLRIGDILLVSIQVELHDELALRFQRELAEKVADEGIRGVIIDISALEIVDSFLGRVLHDIAATTSVLAARTVVVGMRPAVAITLVELGLSLHGLRTALNVEAGLRQLGIRRLDVSGEAR
ncbi:STAS domain-containing protein [Allokutzneria oryzae]|uniref:STAS domain-containing protein n=1 Tax=Allokutzneria oryzae TaxID=1378989 RepID=A0ABV6A7L2_9PSEU